MVLTEPDSGWTMRRTNYKEVEHGTVNVTERQGHVCKGSGAPGHTTTVAGPARNTDKEGKQDRQAASEHPGPTLHAQY